MAFIMLYIKRHRARYLAGLMTLLVVDLANVYIPRIIGVITDGLNDHTYGWGDVKKSLLLLFFVGLTLAIGRFLWRYFLTMTSRIIEKELRNDLYDHLQTLSVAYYNEQKTGDLMTRFTSDMGAIRMAIGPAVICVFDATVMTVMVLFQMMHYVSLKLTLLVLIPMLVICVGEIYYGKIMHPKYLDRQAAVSDLTDYVQESFSGVRVVKAFVQERAQVRSFVKANQKAREKNLRVAKLQSIVMPLLDVIIGLSTLITLLYGGYLALIGEITLGRFVAFNQYVGTLVWPMLACGEAINMFSQGSASIKRIQEILRVQPEIPMEGNVPEKPLDGEITLRNLNFTYNGQTSPTISDVSLEVPAGTTLAIIGRTGAGKTTLANLLLRLFTMEPGQIALDGQEITELSPQYVREQIAYVPQDNFLFSDTIYRNLLFGAPQATEEEVYRATKAACVHDNIVDFPAGYQTVVGERGVTLSGGQKQRTSIARALLKDAPILILDDALSAVDTDTEEQILANLKEYRKGKTTIFIAHRISTIQHADMILVLEDGKAAEIGNHESLLELGGIYASLYEKQQLEAALNAD